MTLAIVQQSKKTGSGQFAFVLEAPFNLRGPRAGAGFVLICVLGTAAQPWL
jgi:hypothetical protein